jgi:ABC-type Na+ transport system ATPase subunit NatA
MIEPKVMEFSEGEYVLHSDYARLKAEVERLQSIHSIDSIGIEQLKAEVERLTSDIQMEKENEDRLVRLHQDARNEVERLTKAGDLMCRMAGNNQVINRHWKTAKKGGQP